MTFRKSLLEVLKKIGYWFLVLVYLELVFRLVMKYSFTLESSLNILFTCFACSAFFALISSIFKEKVTRVFTILINLILGVMFSVQCVFYHILKTYFSFSNLALSDQAAGFFDVVVEGVTKDWYAILLFLLPFFITIIFRKKLGFVKNNWKQYLMELFCIALFVGVFQANMILRKDYNNTYHLYHEVNDVGLNIQKIGVLHSYGLDLYRCIFGFEQKLQTEVVIAKPIEVNKIYVPNVTDLDFTKPTNNQNNQMLNDYFKNDPGTQQSEYTGMFEGYNLVYITAESFYDIAIDENITPTLYKMTHSGFVFKNYYTPYVLSTIGGEFQSLTGLYPDNTILSTWRSGNNYFPYGLGTVFQKEGYNTFAYHNNSYVFQDRHQYLRSQGFNNFLGCWNGLENRMNCYIWPQSDDEMVEVTLGDYIDSDKPFLAYYMTVSGHFAYNFDGGNTMCLRNKDAVQGMQGATDAKAFVATQVELDKALARLIQALEERGKLDKTVFVLLADHYPYALTIDSINSISSYPRDATIEINHNALILWNSKMETVEVEKPCMSIDVLPTVLNLFGVDYDSRIIVGKDILSDAEGLAIMKDYSWVSEKGVYYSSNGFFAPKEGVEVPEGYVENMNRVVANRLNVSRMILQNNYYGYLFG